MNNSNIKISIVIPIYKPHFNIFHNLINQIINQTEKPFELVIACSNCDLINKNTYFEIHRNTIENLNIKYSISDVIDTCLPGINRNRGASIASGNYIMFIDADDIISPFKVEITRKILEKYNPNVFIHSFVWCKDINYKFTNYDINNIIIIDNTKIYNDTLVKFKHRFLPRNKFKESINKFPSQIFINSNIPNIYFHICHGLPCVKKDLFSKHQYINKARGEDGIFLRDILCSDGNIIYSPLELINYKPI
jgi:glycosyltransferase involved in cell wall biosynthesis